MMAMAKKKKKKGHIGRPPTGVGVPVLVRLQPDLLAKVDKWRGAQPGGGLSRPQAIRWLAELGLGEA
jgi:hypothetical protein